MAGKTQKRTVDLSAKITEAYMDYVLTEQKEPASVYAFSKSLDLEESEFYKLFNRLEDIDNKIWLDTVDLTINSLQNSQEYTSYTVREKVLAFFYTFIEALGSKRSYFVYSLNKQKWPINSPDGIKTRVLEFSKQLMQEGLASQELEDRKFLSDRYHEAVWLNTVFIINFWLKDESKGFEKTDAAIEKSVNLMIELMGKSALDSMLDLGKFLFQSGVKPGFNTDFFKR